MGKGRRVLVAADGASPFGLGAGVGRRGSLGLLATSPATTLEAERLDDFAARLALAAAFVLALLAVAGRRARAARLDAGRAGNQLHGQVSAAAAPPPAPRRWSAWDAVPPGLRDDESGRIIALSAVALKAHAAGVLVDLRGAVDRGETPETLVIAALDEFAAPWRAWPETPPPAEPPSTANV